MVAQQVLRISAALALVAALGTHARAEGEEPIALVDLRDTDAQQRATSRAAMHGALVADPRVVPMNDPALAAALAGETRDRTTDDARAALAEATSAYGSLQCPAALAAADRAIDRFAALQARGDDVTAQLVQAYTYVLLCSSNAADLDRAHFVAQRLRGLGANPPPGVSAETWAKYPAIDATTNVYIAEVTIATTAGAQVWIDHTLAGTAPLTTHLSEGKHVVAISHDGATAVTHATVTGREPQQVSVTLAPGQAGRWDGIRDWIKTWRANKRAPTQYDVGQLLLSVNARVAFLATTDPETGEDRLEAWGLRPGQKEAVLIGSAGPAQIGDLVELTIDTVTAWDAGRVAGGTPGPGPGDKKKQTKAKPWWVYAAIVGAVVVGGGIVLASDLADDKQIIRLDHP